MKTLLKAAAETNILLVDDNPDNLRVLTKMLEEQGYVIRKALNGRMALRAAHLEPPDLILLDINMPETNGYEVCQQLKNSENTQYIPIIFISALDQINDKVRAFEIGGQDYITKPFQELEVLARIKNQLLIQQQQDKLLQQQQLLITQNQQLEQEVQERQKAEAEIRRLNTDLEQRVEMRTFELKQAVNFERTLKRISDVVRDSLDQHKILQCAVEELAQVLKVHCCDAVLYSSDHQSSIIRYQYVAPGQPATQGQLLYMADAPEIYEQLQNQRLSFAFCQIQPTPIRNHSAILACPIFDHQVGQVGILGDLWLFKTIDSSFSDMEINLVQQVTNQCAIALRQAQLYEAAQSHIRELERINQLKDDFLSTISHELRTPLASMKMVINLLLSLAHQESHFLEELSHLSNQYKKFWQYFKVLQDECDRELNLVEDLLKLQHIEAGIYTFQPSQINLQDLLPHLVEPFESRLQTQKLTLQINLAPDLPTLNIDSLAINRVITELLNNACKYSPPGETISISANSFQDSETTANTQFVQLIITNSGVEIPPEEFSHIFEKFYRIPNHDPWKYGGTGLGLALVKKLVEKMGGSIHVESGNGKTSFLIKLQ